MIISLVTANIALSKGAILNILKLDIRNMTF